MIMIVRRRAARPDDADVAAAVAPTVAATVVERAPRPHVQWARRACVWGTEALSVRSVSKRVHAGPAVPEGTQNAILARASIKEAQGARVTPLGPRYLHSRPLAIARRLVAVALYGRVVADARKPLGRPKQRKLAHECLREHSDKRLWSARPARPDFWASAVAFSPDVAADVHHPRADVALEAHVLCVVAVGGPALAPHGGDLKAPCDERRATSDERRATSDDCKKSVNGDASASRHAPPRRRRLRNSRHGRRGCRKKRRTRSAQPVRQDISWDENRDIY